MLCVRQGSHRRQSFMYTPGAFQVCRRLLAPRCGYDVVCATGRRRRRTRICFLVVSSSCAVGHHSPRAADPTGRTDWQDPDSQTLERCCTSKCQSTVFVNWKYCNNDFQGEIAFFEAMRFVTSLETRLTLMIEVKVSIHQGI
jgi:hypothetical protein